MRITSLIDVDNTLLDNDAAKVEIDRRLAALLGEGDAARFWTVYEQVRAELGVVDIPRAMGRAFGVGTPLEERIALAEVFMRFPFQDFIYPDALQTIAFLKERGSVVILSDGDAVFQVSKIIRAGLADFAEGQVLVYPHKEEHLPEITAAFPADHYLLIDDKPTVIDRVTKRATELNGSLATIWVRQGKYAAANPAGSWSGATYTVDSLTEIPGLFA